MSRKPLIIIVAVFFLKDYCFGSTLLETKDFILSMDTYLRQDLVTFENIVDLDSQDDEDSTTYLGIDYSLGLRSEFKD
ncbi:MAG: hypothetical protein NTW64_05575, partial [Candidatus Omnitrophica bacterium]|nr:hypothetical protein [Candidatus Omnitrophota bacterium]